MAGVDACRGGWVAVALGRPGALEVTLAGDFASLLDQLAPVDVIGVDIPIGLPENDFRELDLEARQLAARRRHSVFITPPRAALEAATHAEAVAITRRLTGQGLSQQAFALRGKIFQVEACLGVAPPSIHEVHPELSFAAMKGEPAAWPKRSWNGTMERQTLLAREGITLPAELPGLAATPADDVLDAAAAAWTARRIAAGEHRMVPERPQRIAGRPAAIHI